MMRPALDPALAGIVRAVRAHVGGMVVILRADTTPWISLTFTGARHRIALRFDTPAQAARLAAALPEHEFAISGHLVADIGAVMRDGASVRFEALTLEEA